MGLDNPLHIAFLLVIMLLVFGAKRLPEMGKSLGSGMRGFKDAISGEAPQVSLATSSTEHDTTSAPVDVVTASPVHAQQPQVEVVDHQVAA
jgi:sec-independent protein translocase protein TatA